MRKPLVWKSQTGWASRLFDSGRLCSHFLSTVFTALVWVYFLLKSMGMVKQEGIFFSSFALRIALHIALYRVRYPAGYLVN